ncbi:MAG: N-formylglutamate amidohydrolase [Acidobacteriota bacterium]|nr:N-formylglutamate amidohydrolase [Acidobacteriota bacterium]
MSQPISRSLQLLGPDEPSPVLIERAEGHSPYFLTCDHGGARVPACLGDLGIARSDLERHIGWDIGALEVSRRLSQRLDATLVAQVYSRLVIDCNRRPATPPSIPVVSDHTPVPANVDLDETDIEARRAEIHAPYHDAISWLLDERAARGRPTVLVAMHSLTPVLDGVQRPWHISFSMDEDRRLGDSLIEHMRESPELIVGDNEPYQINVVDHTIPVHGASRGLQRVLVEIRQNLIETRAGQREWASRLADALESVLPELAVRI